jgi:hypothetical protein
MPPKQGLCKGGGIRTNSPVPACALALQRLGGRQAPTYQNTFIFLPGFFF